MAELSGMGTDIYNVISCSVSTDPESDCCFHYRPMKKDQYLIIVITISFEIVPQLENFSGH